MSRHGQNDQVGVIFLLSSPLLAAYHVDGSTESTFLLLFS